MPAAKVVVPLIVRLPTFTMPVPGSSPVLWRSVKVVPPLPAVTISEDGVPVLPTGPLNVTRSAVLIVSGSPGRLAFTASLKTMAPAPAAGAPLRTTGRFSATASLYVCAAVPVGADAL